MAKSESEDIIEKEVVDVLALQKRLESAEAKLMQIPEFIEFTKLQKEINAQTGAVWKEIEKQMIDNNVKSVKGEWGSLTIAERLDWDYDPSLLQPKFFKKVVDTKKMSDTFRLEGKPPKAATPRYIKYLVKRFK